MSKRWQMGVCASLGAILLTAGLVNLDVVPPLWWDEGWTLSVARNWVERGHYGQLLNGEPRPPGLAAAFPVVVPIALSFRLFGIGIWQGRLAGVLLTLGALALMWYLADRVYNRRVAIGTLGVLLLMTDPHPLVMGRQVVGEMPSVFYLLTGYALLLPALRRSAPLMLPAIVLWGVALVTKAQVMPFWAASLLLPLSVALLKRWRRAAVCLAMGLSGSVIAAWLFRRLQHAVLRGQTPWSEAPAGMYEVTAVVLDGTVRAEALGIAVTYGLPTLLGLCYGAWVALRRLRQPALPVAEEVVRLALLGLAGSWVAWFLLLAMSWVRYLVPAMFVASMLTAALLHDLTKGFSFVGVFDERKSGQSRLKLAGVVLSAALAVSMGTRTMAGVKGVSDPRAGRAVLQAADFLNTRVAPDAVIESYDSELLFLLNRRYLYPPDQVHVELNRRIFLGQDAPIAYDPLARAPDYLVTGPFSQMWGLYEPVLSTGAFRLRVRFADYRVYERVR